MARTKIAEFAKRAVEEVDEDDIGVPLSPAGTEAGEYERAWLPLIQTMRVGLTLHEELRDVIDLHRNEKRTEELPATDPLARITQIKSHVDALSTRYTDVLGRFLVWKEELRGHLRTVQAHLAGVPVLSAVDETAGAFARAYKQIARLPVEPIFDADSPASLEARLRYLTAVKELAQTAEAFPGAVGRSIQALHETMTRFAREWEDAKMRPGRDNTSAFRSRPPRFTEMGAPAPAPRPVREPSHYEFLVR
jgi:hypothetical protein